MYLNPFFAYMLQLVPFPFHQPQIPKPQPESAKRYQRIWTKSQIQAAYTATLNYCLQSQKSINDLKLNDFEVISRELSQTAQQVMIKISEITNSGTLRPGIWSNCEDSALVKFLEEKPLNWGKIAKAINEEFYSGVRVRTGKQCKERWNNYLNPEIRRGEWTHEEDVKVLQGFKEHGRKWSFISKQMGNRTESAVKNRIKSLLNKIRLELRGLENLETGIEKFIQSKVKNE